MSESKYFTIHGYNIVRYSYNEVSKRINGKLVVIRNIEKHYFLTDNIIIKIHYYPKKRRVSEQNVPNFMVFEEENNQLVEVFSRIPIVDEKSYNEGCGIFYPHTEDAFIKRMVKPTTEVEFDEMFNMYKPENIIKFKELYEKFALEAKGAMQMKKVLDEDLAAQNEMKIPNAEDNIKQLVKTYSFKR